MHRYYNPSLSPDEMDALDRQNIAALTAVQACLGNVSPDMRAIFVDAGTTAVTLHFVVRRRREAACAEDIEDTIFEYEAQHWPGIEADVVAQVHTEEVPRDWFQRGWRPIYWAKDWAAWQEREEDR